MGEIYVNKEVMCKQIYKDQFFKMETSMSDFILKCWLKSVFVTNAKGGDCWNYDIFVISANTYSTLNAYLAHHLVYITYQAFSGYLISSTSKQLSPSIPEDTE